MISTEPSVLGAGATLAAASLGAAAAAAVAAAAVGALCDDAPEEQAEACGHLEWRDHGKARAKPVPHTAVLQRPGNQRVDMAKAACFMVNS